LSEEKNMSKNLVLIGMPGSGKTTIGKLVSEKLNYDFVDMDEYMKAKYKKTINDMFLNGEDYFRQEESKCCEEICKIQTNVISTGGGVIKKKQNVDLLGSTGVIIFIDRTVENILSDIEVSSRPLLKDGKEKLYKLYEERYNLYREYAHIIIKNDKNLDQVVEEIVNKYKEANNSL
jgi:shikimate kinase